MKLPEPIYTVKMIAENNKHYYRIGDDPTYHPGITGLLDYLSKPALVPWAAKEASKYWHRKLVKLRSFDLLHRHEWDSITIRFFQTLCRRARKQPKFAKDNAARRGTTAHDRFDSILNGTGDMQQVAPFMDSFRYWTNKETLEFVCGGMATGSKRFGIGGTIDGLLWDHVTKRFVVAEFKTGNNLWDTHAGQASGYAVCLKEQFRLEQTPGAVVIRFHETKKYFQRWEVLDTMQSFDILLAGLAAHRALSLNHWNKKQIIKEKKGDPNATEANGKKGL